MRKIIFLDCDGVIATQKSKYCLDKECCDLLQEIVDETGAEIVITSSWRLVDLDATLNLFQKGLWGDKPDHRFTFIPTWANAIVGQTVRGYSFVKSGGRPFFIPRGVEIKQWLDENVKEDFTYVILDDDSDMLLWQKDNFIQTNTKEGLNKSQAKQAIDILNGNSKRN